MQMSRPLDSEGGTICAITTRVAAIAFSRPMGRGTKLASATGGRPAMSPKGSPFGSRCRSCWAAVALLPLGI